MSRKPKPSLHTHQADGSRPNAGERDAINKSWAPGLLETVEKQRTGLDYFEGLVGHLPEWKKLVAAEREFIHQCLTCLNTRDWYERYAPPLKSRRGEKWRYLFALNRAHLWYGHDEEKLRKKLTEIEVDHHQREILYERKQQARVNLDLRSHLMRRKYNDLVAAHILLLRKILGKVEEGSYARTATLLNLSAFGFKLSRNRVKEIVKTVTKALRLPRGHTRYPLSAAVMARLARADHPVKA